LILTDINGLFGANNCFNKPNKQKNTKQNSIRKIFQHLCYKYERKDRSKL